jgi:hypothetical protein
MGSKRVAMMRDSYMQMRRLGRIAATKHSQRHGQRRRYIKLTDPLAAL